MGKRKLITGGLVFLILLLCMISIYLQRQFNNLQVAFNRVDREYIMLQADYKNLYEAYYSYDKKILKILEGNPHVLWAQDSSAYVVKIKDSFIFCFYKKPKMEVEMNLWIETEVAFSGLPYQTINESYGRVDNLKPHEWVLIDHVPLPNLFYVVEPIYLQNGQLTPKEGKRLAEIKVKH